MKRPPLLPHWPARPFLGMVAAVASTLLSKRATALSSAISRGLATGTDRSPTAVPCRDLGGSDASDVVARRRRNGRRWAASASLGTARRLINRAEEGISKERGVSPPPDVDPADVPVFTVYYNDVYEVKLPPNHRFPMEKYRRVREIVQGRIASLPDEERRRLRCGEEITRRRTEFFRVC